jgi:hypothetical protein
VSTSAGIVVSIFTQLAAPEHPPWSGPCRIIVLSSTSIEPDVAQDWLYDHSLRASALAEVIGEIQAKSATGK